MQEILRLHTHSLKLFITLKIQKPLKLVERTVKKSTGLFESKATLLFFVFQYLLKTINTINQLSKLTNYYNN